MPLAGHRKKDTGKKIGLFIDTANLGSRPHPDFIQHSKCPQHTQALGQDQQCEI